MNKFKVSENGLGADFYCEESDLPKKAIIMLGGSEGGKTWSRIRRPLSLMVQQGYALLSLAYFKAPGLPASLEQIPLEYFEKAFAWLSAQPQIVPGDYAILGASKGAEAALLLATKSPQVKAVVALTPTSVVWQGIPKKRFDIVKAPKSSWSYQGKDLPFLPYPESIKKIANLLTLRFRAAHEEALRNVTRAKEAAIPVEDSSAAMLLISAKRDRMWPSTIMAEKITARLARKGYSAYFRHIPFDTSHNGLILKKDCWRAIFAFLKEQFV